MPVGLNLRRACSRCANWRQGASARRETGGIAAILNHSAFALIGDDIMPAEMLRNRKSDRRRSCASPAKSVPCRNRACTQAQQTRRQRWLKCGVRKNMPSGRWRRVVWVQGKARERHFLYDRDRRHTGTPRNGPRQRREFDQKCNNLRASRSRTGDP